MTGWRLAADLRIHEWDGQTVVYDRASGDTHCLDPVLSAVVGRLAESGATAEAALATAMEKALASPPEAAVECLPVALTELQRLGLVEPA